MTLLFIILSIIIIVVFTLIYRDINDDDLNEKFIDDYYAWTSQWTNHEMVNYINENKILNKKNCRNCMYSMSCDLLDDAQPWCHKSYDVPEIVIDKQNGIKYSKFHSV